MQEESDSLKSELFQTRITFTGWRRIVDCEAEGSKVTESHWKLIYNSSRPRPRSKMNLENLQEENEADHLRKGWSHQQCQDWKHGTGQHQELLAKLRAVQSEILQSETDMKLKVNTLEDGLRTEQVEEDASFTRVKEPESHIRVTKEQISITWIEDEL